MTASQNVKNNAREVSMQHEKLMRWATYFSVLVALFLIGLKIIGWRLTNSISLLATLIDSLLDCIASFINLIAVRHALRPADKEHRFGHGKAEALAALGQSFFIIGSGMFLLYESIGELLNPQPPTETGAGVNIMILSMIITICLVVFQNYVVKKTNSIAIAADSAHYKTDLFINLGVILTLMLAAWTQTKIVEVFFVFGVVGYISYMGYYLIKDAINMLMDHEWPEEKRQTILKIICSHEAVSGVHDLRTRQSGKQSFIQFHLEMKGDYSLSFAHQVAEEVEAQIIKEFPNCEVMIHQDPIEQL